MGRNFGMILELVLVLGVVVGFGGWQLWSLSREQRRDRSGKD